MEKINGATETDLIEELRKADLIEELKKEGWKPGDTLPCAERAIVWMNSQRKRRSRKNRRILFVKWVGGFFAFIGFWGLLVVIAHFSFLMRELVLILAIITLWLGSAFLFYKTYYWILHITGIYLWYEDWIEAWDTWDNSYAGSSQNIYKFKEFPRRKRETLVSELEKKLNVIIKKFPKLKGQASEKLLESIESIEQCIDDLLYECRWFLNRDTSWISFALQLEETPAKINLALADIKKHHKKVPLPLEKAHLITSVALLRIIDL